MLRDIADLTGVEAEIQAQLAAAVSDAERWLKGQAQVRRKLFSQLEEALAERDVLQVRQLLARVNATAGHDRTADENAIADVAASYLAEQQRVYAEQLQAEAAAKLAQQQDARERRAADRVQTLLATLERRGVDKPLKTMRKLVRELMHATSDAGDGVDAGQQEQIGVWKTRAEIGGPWRRLPVPLLRRPRRGRRVMSRWRAGSGSRRTVRAARPWQARTVSSTPTPVQALRRRSPTTNGSSAFWQNAERRTQGQGGAPTAGTGGV